MPDAPMPTYRSKRYVHESCRRRSSGTVVEVLDTAHPHSEFDLEVWPSGYDANGNVTGWEANRWVTVCVDHGELCTHRTFTLASDHATYSAGWCEACRDEEFG